MEGLRVRTVLAILGALLAVVWVAPNLVNMENKWWPSKNKLNYGLDIQGGLHLVMGVDVAGVLTESTTRLAASLKSELGKENIGFTDIKSSNAENGEITISATDAAAKEKAKDYINKNHGTALQEMSDSGNDITFRYYDAYINDYKSKVIHQAIETIRNRIDEFGVSEPSIIQQGANRILVQLPGMADAERAKELINTTAKLDFMIVSEEKSMQELQAMIADAEKTGGYSMTTLKYTEYVNRLNADLKTKLPANTTINFEKSENATKMEIGAVPFLLKSDTNLSGGSLDDATVGYGQYGEPEVSLTFNAAGSKRFGEVTTIARGKRVAIVLDKVVKSAPNINEPITGGRARITLGRGLDRQKTMDEAKMISTALRAGALPATLEQLEERRVGPSLGSDSIGKAKMGSYIGAILIIIFMAVYYRSMGVIADVCLALNILSVFALLTSLGATLTLPGIAAIALTVGFAVDANVLINERIREELGKGASWKHAIQEGYHRAMSAIVDANITTAATALVLLYFGTGPVRGFAVNLLIGVITTMFANVFVSKVIVDTLVTKFGIKKLSV
jgi:preprotein translocase subunit SecD